MAFDGDRVVGFINAIGDGELAAFIPWLEVLPSHQGNGVGGELLRRLRAELDEHYSIDLICDRRLGSYYSSLGFQDWSVWDCVALRSCGTDQARSRGSR